MKLCAPDVTRCFLVNNLPGTHSRPTPHISLTHSLTHSLPHTHPSHALSRARIHRHGAPWPCVVFLRSPASWS